MNKCIYSHSIRLLYLKDIEDQPDYPQDTGWIILLVEPDS